MVGRPLTVWFSNSFKRETTLEAVFFGEHARDWIFSARRARACLTISGDLGHLVNAHEGVHFRQQLGQFVAKPLRQTAGNDQTLAAVFRLAELGGFQNGVHAFLLRGVNEGAGVDDDGVGLRRRSLVISMPLLRSEPSMISASTRFLAQPSEIRPTRNGPFAGRSSPAGGHWNILVRRREREGRKLFARRNWLRASWWPGKTAAHVVGRNLTGAAELVSAGIPSWVRITARAAKGSPFCGSRNWFSTMRLRRFIGGSATRGWPLPIFLDNGHRLFREQLETGGVIVAADRET